MWITWKHEDTDFGEPLTFDQKVDVFYEQTLGWQLHIADLIANGGTTFDDLRLRKAGDDVRCIRHSGFAVLHICLSYFELIGSLVTAAQQSPRKKFDAGVRAVFPDFLVSSDTAVMVLRRLYEGARCGLYHEGRTRHGVGLGQPTDGSAIAYDPRNDEICISPERLPQVLKEHLKTFKQMLLNPANTKVRRRFEHRFDRGFTHEPPTEALQPMPRARRKVKPKGPTRAARG